MLKLETLNVGDIIFHDRTSFPLEYLGEDMFKDTHGVTHKESVSEIEDNYHIVG